MDAHEFHQLLGLAFEIFEHERAASLP
jgi:hypothetical protein